MPGGLHELDARELFMSDLFKLPAPGLLLVLVQIAICGHSGGRNYHRYHV